MLLDTVQEEQVRAREAGRSHRGGAGPGARGKAQHPLYTVEIESNLWTDALGRGAPPRGKLSPFDMLLFCDSLISSNLLQEEVVEEVAVAIGVHLVGEVGDVVEVVGGVHSVSTFTLSLLRFRVSFVSYCRDNDRVFITIVDLSGPTLSVC